LFGGRFASGCFFQRFSGEKTHRMSKEAGKKGRVSARSEERYERGVVWGRGSETFLRCESQGSKKLSDQLNNRGIIVGVTKKSKGEEISTPTNRKFSKTLTSRNEVSHGLLVSVKTT